LKKNVIVLITKYREFIHILAYTCDDSNNIEFITMYNSRRKEKEKVNIKKNAFVNNE